MQLIKRFFRWFISLFDVFGKQKTVDYMYGEALPKPLTAEEEREVLTRFASGDKDAKNELIERNLRLVVYIAKKFEGSVSDTSDLVSVGAIGLIKAVNSFNVERNIKLATFASRCIENEILMYLRKTVKQKCEISLDEPLNTDWEGNELLLGDIIGTDPDAISKEMEKKAEIDILYKSFYKLNPREILIMKLRYGLMNTEEKTQKEIADMMGISQSYISRLEKKVLIKLRKEMSKFI
ncbi:MAG: sigma-70 family RNA polymerase sigma factor [Clostridia bacterium]|nr:sigma-70 family RNA polymerase sigma factor [Clostridia bacterium]